MEGYLYSRRKAAAAVVERKNVNFGVGGGEEKRYPSSDTVDIRCVVTGSFH